MKYLSLAIFFLLTGCATQAPYDYTAFRKHEPKSILILPPLNQSTDIKATYSCLSAMTQPVAEHGYYVFPVEIIDRMLKENGLPTPDEMHQASLKKIGEIINPDAVLYLNIENYGTKFLLVDSNTHVTISGRLVHTQTGTILWEGKAEASHSANAGQSNQGLVGMMVGAMVAQAVNSSVDAARDICRIAISNLITNPNQGFLKGPYSPKEAN